MGSGGSRGGRERRRGWEELGQEGLRGSWKDHLALGVGLGSRSLLGSDKGTEIRGGLGMLLGRVCRSIVTAGSLLFPHAFHSD